MRKKKIKILHVAQAAGGVDRYIRMLLKYLVSTAIEKLYDDISESGADVAVPAFCISFENGDCAVDSRVKEVTTYSKKEALEVFLFNGYLTPCVASKMWKKSLWQKIRCPEGKLFEDQYTTYKLLMLANKIVFDPEVYYYYFKRSGSIGHSSFSKRTYDLLFGIGEQYETIKKYLQKFPESMHIRAAFIIASEAIYSPSAEYKRVPDKIINKAKQWSEQYPKKIEFQEAYFGLLFSRLKYAQAQDMRNEQRRVYREMKTVAERANYSEYNESNQLMESVDILHRVFGY